MAVFSFHMESARYARSEDAPAMAVLEAVADHTDTDPADLDTPLYQAIDPDALDRLVESAAAVTVSFEYAGHAVTVESNGEIDIDCQPRSGGGFP